MPKKPKMELNEHQIKAIKHKQGPLMVVAGAGTGKTRVITEKVKFLIEENGVKPKEILALTFTEKASKEMQERIGDVMPLGYEEPWVCTFHAFAERILRAEGLELGLDPSFKILADPDRWLLIRKNLFKFNIEYFRPLGNPTKFISAILTFISRLQDETIYPSDFRKFAEDYPENPSEPLEKQRWQELAHIYERYESLKTEKSKLDFGDLITWTIKLFKERPNILNKYKSQFKHILVDEFQDTNYAQYELIKLLCPPEMDKRSLTVVGDDSQSIYKFRGAAISNILQFMQEYHKSDMVTLLQNYRSTQNILDPAYKLIQNNNPDTLEVKLNISKELVSQLGEDLDPKIAFMETGEDEVEFVVSKILEILAKEPQYTYKDFAVLSRANSHLDSFVMAFRKYGIPYQLVGNRGLYDREEIRDVLSILKATINPSDGINLFRVLNIETLDIPYDLITGLLTESRSKKIDLWQSVKESQEVSLTNLVSKISEFQQNITKATPSEFVYNVVNSIGYVKPLMANETVENQLKINNLDIFLKRVEKFEVAYHDENKNMPTVIDLIDYLELMMEAGENPAQAEIEDIDTINLMTVHASKGLEFPVVFMTNLISGRFPSRNKKDVIGIPDELVKETLPTGDEHIQEERRLFYVGMTRAKKYLYMTAAKDYGGKRASVLSGYLSETGLKIEEIKSAEVSSLEQKQSQNSLFGVNTGFRDARLQKITEFAPTSLSYSQIDCYETCPLQYKFSYVLHIPAQAKHSLSFGNTIHYSLRDFHYKLMFNPKVTSDELMEIYQKNWQPLGYLDEDHRNLRFENGKKLLEDYYEKNVDKKVTHEALEKPFTIKLGDTKFTGRIDRIDRLDNGGVEIIDYKTGAPKTQKEVDKDQQVSIYAIAAKEALGLDPKILSLYFVETGEKVSTTRNDEQLEKTKEHLIEVVENIKSGNFDATPGMHCEWCSYKDTCPFAYK